MSKTPSSDSVDFESAYQELEAIIARMESGVQSLESSLTDFERAVSLMKVCHDKLNNAEQTVKMLTQDNEELFSLSTENSAKN